MSGPGVPGLMQGHVLRRRRLIVPASLLGLAAAAWIYLWRETAGMSATAGLSVFGPGAMAQGVPPAWSPEWLALTFVMWSIMMVAMMLPSAMPAIILYAAMTRRDRSRGRVLAPSWIFTAGYLAAWTLFSLVVTVLQAFLQANALVTPMMVSDSAWLTGALLIVAGTYQWLPVKDACLNRCRDPLRFFLFRWRPGNAGAFCMGIEHGAFCTGCCWALMLLLFVAGVMNLLWVAAIAGYVLVEKLLPAGRFTGRVTGVALVAAGGVIIA